MSSLEHDFDQLSRHLQTGEKVILPELKFANDAQNKTCLKIINLPNLPDRSPANSFSKMVAIYLSSLPQEKIPPALESFSDEAFKSYLQISANSNLSSQKVPVAAFRLITIRDNDPKIFQNLIFSLRSEIRRRKLNIKKNVHLVLYFLMSDVHRDRQEKKELIELLQHWFKRLELANLWCIFDRKNTLFIGWVLTQSKESEISNSLRGLMNYYWICAIYAEDRVPEIRNKMQKLASSISRDDRSVPKDIYNSINWLADGKLAKVAAPIKMVQPVRGLRLRIAICVSGQMRGFEKAYGSWSKALSLDDVDYDIYLHTWREVGRKALTRSHIDRNLTPKFGALFAKEWEKDRDDFPNRYPSFFRLFRSEEVINEALIHDVFSPKVMVVDDGTLFPADVPNVYRMHYKIEKCYDLALMSGKPYDLILRMRPDKNLQNCGGIDWDKIYKDVVEKKCVFTDNGIKIEMPHGMVTGDQFTLSDPIAAPGVFRIWSTPASLVQKTINGQMKFVELGLQLRQHYTLSQSINFSGRQVKSFPYPIFRKGPNGLLDPHQISHCLILQKITEDAELRMDEIDRRLIHTCTEEYQASQL